MTSTSPSSSSAGTTSTPSVCGEILANGSQLTIQGDWILDHYSELQARVSRILGTLSSSTLQGDISSLGRVDTAGAALLAELLGAQALADLADTASGLTRERRALLHAVATAMGNRGEPQPPSYSPVKVFLAATGQRVEELYDLLRLLVAFIGETLAVLAYNLPRPRRWRVTSFVASVQDTGLNALPIVALLTFLVGAVVAFLGATVLEAFGATIYTVNLVAFSFLREFGVLLAAILLAGRTASSFTAHIGAMKVNEELDAIRTLGLSPVELLVLPRVLAMMISLPLLTFVGMISGIAGGAAVCALVLDISPTQFLAIVEQDIALRHFLVGLSKAPVFAFLIAVIGCLEGFKVNGSAQSVGEHTTSSVVQSIFMVILLDSIAALFFMEMGW
ncbi:ABC transporter permease [Marinobacter sp. NP-4(2019)]|uniref:MlaE family ABC transporter permease n=1 Tax=Marinobacter sp. NP-4(2019) TaxID=2488665 RepID=UPI000FC3D30C|nr:ABC transporter permease [Marinobacter sp. NP-4(2019)]AZT83777.1 ABC transporter permease [Marinobacter sp. NP-4(2019)]